MVCMYCNEEFEVAGSEKYHRNEAYAALITHQAKCALRLCDCGDLRYHHYMTTMRWLRPACSLCGCPKFTWRSSFVLVYLQNAIGAVQQV